MPPPVPAHQKRFTANPARPARYRPGKAIAEEETSDEDEEVEPEQPPKLQQKTRPRPAPVRSAQVAHEEEEGDDDEEGFVTEEEDDADGGAPVPSPTVKQPLQVQHQIGPQEASIPLELDQEADSALEPDSKSEEESDEESDEESEEESSSEDEAQQRRFQRPTFIKKTERRPQSSLTNEHTEVQQATPAPEIASSHYTDATAARRLAEAEGLIKTAIERDTAARLAGKKSWDDDDDLPLEALVDDTDGLNPEAERAAWRLRELHRLKRDREAMITREKELEEIERRRNLSKEERAAEDREFIARQKEQREEGRGKVAYLNKYHHKGAFFMDDEASERLAKRDLMGVKFADDVDKTTLPEYMRIRDMTKLGKKGRTRYTDLMGQDTGRFGEDVKRWRGSGYTENAGGGAGIDMRGVDERFLPDNRAGPSGPRVSGANASAVAERRKRDRSRSLSPQRGGRSREHDSYRPRSSSRDWRRRSYSVSRSRSPPYRSGQGPSPYRERDKRRRTET